MFIDRKRIVGKLGIDLSLNRLRLDSHEDDDLCIFTNGLYVTINLLQILSTFSPFFKSSEEINQYNLIDWRFMNYNEKL